jgi:hypothetical protein
MAGLNQQQQPVRDDGDGSSSSTNADEPTNLSMHPSRSHLSVNRPQTLSGMVHQRVIRTSSQDRLLDVNLTTNPPNFSMKKLLNHIFLS